jgi:3-hydroxyisobutyrate dehydrogenase
MSSTPRVGILGLGRMGRAMAARLAGQGFQVAGWTRSGVTAAAGVPGIVACAQIPMVAAAADILVLSLSDDAAVSGVVLELARGELSGKLIVDTSTIGPDTLRGLADVIGKAGGGALDAPISGGPDLVAQGKAGFYIGGAAADVDRFMGVARALSDRIHHVGPLGAGAAAKIVNNMMLMGFWQALKEALSVGKRAGLDLEMMLKILSTSPAASGAFQHRLPVLRGESSAVGFPVAGVVKDGAMFSRVARDLQVDTPAIAAAIASFRAYDAAGHGDEDLARMVRAAYEAV